MKNTELELKLMKLSQEYEKVHKLYTEHVETSGKRKMEKRIQKLELLIKQLEEKNT